MSASWRIRVLPLALFAVIGAGSLVVASLLYQLAEREQRASFSLLAADRVAAIDKELRSLLRPIRHAAAMFSVWHRRLTQNDFELLVTSMPLADHPALLTFQWMAPVPGAEAESKPDVRFQYPPQSGEATMPTAIPTSVNRELFAAARARNALVLSPWYRVGDEVRMRVLRPVYPPDNRKDGDVVGFVSAFFRVDAIIKSALGPHRTGPTILYARSRDFSGFLRYANGEATYVASLPPDLQKYRRVSKRIISDSTPWQLLFLSKRGYDDTPWPSLLIGFGGVLFGGVLALYLHALATSRRDVVRLVQERTRELERRTEQLRRTNEELEEFSYVASHDLKAPLRAISHLTTWLNDDLGQQLDSENRERLALIRARVARMDQLIEGLLAYARSGTTAAARHEAVPLRPLVDDIVGELVLPPGFRVEIDDPLPVLEADPIHLRQIFQNLMTNAIVHHDRPGTGCIRIRAREAEKTWELEVADNGPGIPAELQEQVFRMFVTTGGADDETHSGIGLPIVRKLVRGYGGEIEVMANPPRGTLFRIHWPR